MEWHRVEHGSGSRHVTLTPLCIFSRASSGIYVLVAWEEQQQLWVYQRFGATFLQSKHVPPQTATWYSEYEPVAFGDPNAAGPGLFAARPGQMTVCDLVATACEEVARCIRRRPCTQVKYDADGTLKSADKVTACGDVPLKDEDVSWLKTNLKPVSMLHRADCLGR